MEEEEARGAKAGRRRACLMSFHGVFLQWCWHAVVFLHNGKFELTAPVQR